MKRALMLILLVSLFTCSRGQNNHLYFDRLDIQKGLPESFVRAIVEDTEGYMWIATQNGLVRYDGYKYKIYVLGSEKLNVTSVTNIFSIVADNARKTIWVSTAGNGIFRYNRQKDSFDQFATPSKKYFQYTTVRAIDGEGNPWGSINDDGISKAFKLDLKTGKYDLFSNKEKGDHFINAGAIYSVRATDNNKVWLCTNNGLYGYSGNSKPFTAILNTADTLHTIGLNPVYEPASQPGVLWANIFHGYNQDLRLAAIDLKTGKIIKQYLPAKMPDSLANAGINAIYEDKKQRLWFGTTTGLSMLNRQTSKFSNYTFADTSVKNLSQISSTADGKLWITTGRGLLYFDPDNGNFRYYKQDATQAGGLSSTSVQTKFIDHTNTLWLGLAYAGVNKVSKIKSAFETFKLPGGPQGTYRGEKVRVVSATKDHTWLATNSAIYNWRESSGQMNKIFSALPGQKLADVFADDDVLFIGSNNGFIVYDVSTGQKDTYKNNANDSASVPANTVQRVFKDHEGIVWLGIGNDLGICSFNPATKKFTRYPFHINYDKLYNINDGSLDDGRVVTIYEDRQNTLWIGTNSGSLNKFDRKTRKFFSYFNKQNERMSCVSQIYEDRSGRFWVGTYLTGVFEFDRNKGVITRQINEKSGLMFNSITGLKEDSAGRIWIGSDRGITRLDPRTMTLRNFKMNDILPGRELSSLDPVSLSDGRFVLSTNEGIAFFHPKDLDDDPNVPVVHLENIRYNKPGANDSLASVVLTYGLHELKLSHNENSVQFNYIGLHYENPANNTYVYMLEGYDKQWVQAGTNRSVTYSNLPPGTYTFKIKAANSSGVWSRVVYGITVVISPPWWLSWWAWLLYIVALAAAIYIYINYRQRHLKLENELLEEKVEERTNELQDANKELQEQQEEIKAQRDQLANTLGELQSTQQQLIQSEKLASLGELTAGIAHEIQNPLNFVNNFSEVSIELAVEMKQELHSGSKNEAAALADDIILNLEKIVHHGKRADGIVKNMLQHSRNNTGEKQPADINALVDEYLRLSYHGLRAKEKNFNSEMVLDLDPDLPKITIIPQDMGRVMLNLFNNAFYSVQQKKAASDRNYKPMVEVTTHLFKPPTGPAEVRIYVKDNGIGISENIKDKIMQPFFTTKPTGAGTGLGLSLSYDIVVKGHGGKMKLSSREGEYAEFIIQLPLV
ncbi:hypothetical protein A0256_15610 [Mucilaginibacter sp. PAMC 26640]|nr:hypothetical protein A0256_15610 [Mucilaginibacter sp. PAMC 26640]